MSPVEEIEKSYAITTKHRCLSVNESGRNSK